MVWAKLATVATAFGQTTVGSGPAPDQLTRAWKKAQGRLPGGWSMDGLRCAATDSTPESRSDDWVAKAVGPAGEERSHQADSAISALEGLAASFDP
jgi:hypothetical protein